VCECDDDASEDIRYIAVWPYLIAAARHMNQSSGAVVKLKVEVDILMTSPSIIVLTVSVDVKQH